MMPAMMIEITERGMMMDESNANFRLMLILLDLFSQLISKKASSFSGYALTPNKFPSLSKKYAV